MRPVALAVMVAVAFIYACSSEIDMYPVGTQSNSPVVGQSQHGPTSPDAGPRDGGAIRDSGVSDSRISDARGGPDALPTAFDAGAPTDVGSPPADAPIPP